MAYTLQDFLDSGIIDGYRMLTKEQDYSGIVVTGGSIAPSREFSRPGDLVLLTEEECIPEETGYFTRINHAMRTHAAAVLFYFFDKTKHVPAKDLDYANSIGLPVIEITRPYHFSDILAQLTEAVHMNTLSSHRALQDKLYHMFFSGSDLREAVAAIAVYMKMTARLVSSTGKEVASFCYNGAPAVESNFDLAREQSLSVHIGEESFGQLLLYPEEEEQICGGDWEVAEQCLTYPISLWFNKESIETLTKAQIKGDFVHNLAFGRYDEFEEMVHIGEKLHFDITLPYTCIALRMQHHEKEENGTEYSDAFAQRVRLLENLFLGEATRLGRRVMMTTASATFLIFLENRGEGKALVELVKEYVDRLNAQLEIMFPDNDCLWGISEIKTDSHDFSLLYRNARMALQFCINSKGRMRQLYYQEATTALIISILSEDARLKKEVDRLVLPLLNYHESSNIDLFGTLASYIRNGDNKVRTAEELHIHRQSLQYRLDKIEELTGMSLANANDHYVLETCARIFQAF